MTVTSYPADTLEISCGGTPPRAEPGTVRRATGDEIPELARVLALAFEADPVSAWFFPDDSDRLHRLERMFALIWLPKLALPHEETYTTESLAGAALWQPPGSYETGPVESLRLLPGMARVWGRGLPRALRGLSFMESVHPHEPHYYLPILGVDPEWQGHGIGSAILGPMLERCDSEEMPAYLEATTPRNRELYRRNGFAVTEEIRFPDDGPPLWKMWREPVKRVSPLETAIDLEGEKGPS